MGQKSGRMLEIGTGWIDRERDVAYDGPGCLDSFRGGIS
jgi:hypothetical protein